MYHVLNKYNCFRTSIIQKEVHIHLMSTLKIIYFNDENDLHIITLFQRQKI